jgi:hypothetical protein
MNASRPEADTEYSSSHRAPTRAQDVSRGRLRRHRATVLVLGLVGVALLVAAELSPLLHLRTVAARPLPAGTIETGPHHDWALMPIAALALLLSGWVWRTGRRPGLAGLALLGAAAIVVAVVADLPDVHATGLTGSPTTGLRNSEAHPAIGLYLETLGGAVLLVAAAAGALLAPTTVRERRGPRRTGAE